MKKKYSLFALITFQLSIINLTAQGYWFKKTDFTLSARSAAVGFAIGQQGYVGTGTDSAAFKRNFAVYQSATDTWAPAQSFGGASGSGLARDAASAFVLGNKAYIGLGQGTNPFFKDFWQYDPATDVWSQMANFGGTGRRSAIGFAVNGKGYVACGQDQTGFKKDLWMYDTLSNSWTLKTAFPGTARRLPVAFVVGTKVYVGTGDDGVFKKDFYEYDAVANSWAVKAQFGGTARYGAVAFAIGTDGYVGTGYASTLSNTKDFWKYNSLTDIWTQVTSFGGTSRANAVAFSIGNYGYVATGYDSSTTTKDIWMYDPLATGVEEISKSNSNVKIFPNPLTDNATIIFNSGLLNTRDKISFLLYDVSGREVKNIQKINSAGFSFNRENLESGIYFYKIISGNNFLASGKIMVQ